MPSRQVVTQEAGTCDRTPIALVTGAAGGIGAAISHRLSRAGYRLVLVDHDLDRVESLAVTLGPSHLGVKMEISDEAMVRSVINEMTERMGGLDLLVNNAARADTGSSALDEKIEDFRSVVDVGLVGTFIVSRAAAPYLMQSKVGAIVNIGSILGAVPAPFRNAYSATKAGVRSLTQSMACEFATSGVRVNAVAPGMITTPMFESHIKAGRIDTETVLRRTPMGRFGRPEEIADAVYFLGSTASSFITGSILVVDGGWAAYGASGPAFVGELPFHTDR